MENVKEPLDAEITLLFNNAIDKLGKVDDQAKEKKKQIITDLARNLEGKIQTDTISMEIVNQLRGNVSERFIHECLEEKYKQKIRVENARKQKHLKKERKVIDKLAVLPPLNLEEDEDEEKNKEVVILDVDGRIFLQEDGDEPSITTDASTTKGRIVVPASNEQDQEHPLKKQINPSLEECTRCRELHFENRELKEALEKSSTLTTADKMVYTSTFNNDGNTPNDVLPFEFSILYRELRYHLAPLHSKIGDHGKVWFRGKIDKNTGIVVSSNLGRIEQQQQDECIDIANRDDLQNE